MRSWEDTMAYMRAKTLASAARIDAEYSRRKINGSLYKKPYEPWPWTRNEADFENGTHSQRRRARIDVLPYDLTPEQLTEINASFDSTCALTGEPADLHADHVIPVSIGHGGTTYGNMIPLSATLNMSKHNAHLYEWFDANKERLNLEQSRFDALIEYLAEVNKMTIQDYRMYVDWCFDNPRIIDETTGELIFKRDIDNEKGTSI